MKGKQRIQEQAQNEIACMSGIAARYERMRELAGQEERQWRAALRTLKERMDAAREIVAISGMTHIGGAAA